MAAIKAILPEYPAEYVRTKIQGKVSVQVLVDAEGSVINATVWNTKHPLMAESVSSALKQWRFKPFTEPNEKVPCLAESELTFAFLILNGKPIVVDEAAAKVPPA